MDGFGASAGRRFGCPSCGGGLRYEIASGEMICDRCGGRTPLEKLAEDPAEQDSGSLEVTEFHCPQCGAVVYSTDTSVTGFCSFCGSDVVFSGRLGRTRRPSAIVPFTVTREQCEAAYREHLSHYRLLPREMKSAETVSHFRPVYVPFWSYRVLSEGTADLKGVKSYTSGKYQITENYDLSMHAEIDQRGILYDASSAFEDETAAMLQHTASEARPFHPAYLSGFYAQASDVPPETYQEEAAATAVRLFMDQVRDQNAMTSVEMTGDVEHAFGLPNARFEEELVMMPVWLLAQRRGGRVVYTAVNGSGGQVVCDIPVSAGKTVGVIGALAAVLFVLLYLVLALKPDVLMVLCAAILLVTQLQFSGAQKVLRNRRTRAYEPDFTGEKPAFVGPAQSLLKRKDQTVSVASRPSAKKQRSQLPGYLILAAVFLGIMLVSNRGRLSLNELMNLSRGESRLLMLPVMFLLLLGIVAHFAVNFRRGAGSLLPRVLSLAACAVGLVFLLLRQSEDLLYYGCSAVMLLAAVWELLIITRAHNEYASRPIPFFGEEAS